MNSLIRMRIVAVAAIMFVGVGAFVVAEEMKKSVGVKEIIWPADKIEFKAVVPGVTQAVLWGDPTKGKYGAITKFAAGIKHPLHTHSSDIKMVVISGTLIIGSEGVEHKLSPGSYILAPAGKKHTSGSDAGSECMFFEEGSGKFTMTMVDDKTDMKK